jgi:hypothetical protein
VCFGRFYTLHTVWWLVVRKVGAPLCKGLPFAEFSLQWAGQGGIYPSPTHPRFATPSPAVAHHLITHPAPYPPYGHRRTGSVPARSPSPSPSTQTSQPVPTFTTTYAYRSSNSRLSSPSKSWSSQSRSYTSTRTRHVPFFP